MSTHICSKCGHEEAIFGTGGGSKMAEDYKIELLGQLPLDISIRQQVDGGHPSVVADPQSRVTQTYKSIARRVAVKVAEKAKDHSAKFPTIVIKNS